MDPDSYLCRLAELFDGVTVTAPSVGELVAIGLAVLLLFASGFVSASEIAFFSLSPSDLNDIENDNHPSDKHIRSLLDDSERLLATILISNNFVNVTIIMLCNFFFAGVIDFGTSVILEFLVITVVLTFLLLLFGEIMPKIYSAQHTLKFCRMAAPVIDVLKKFFSPISNMLVRSTVLVNKCVSKKNYNISVDELSQALELTDKNEISEESNILEGVIRFGGETVKEVMTPRMDIVDLEIQASFSEVMACVVENAYSRIPVYEDSIDNIKGILYIKDLLPHLKKGDGFKWQNLVRPAFFVPETKMIDDLLRDFQENKIHVAIVVDEYGATQGLVSVEDILEEVVGEISDESDVDESFYERIDDNTYIFDGKTHIVDFERVVKCDEDIFADVQGRAETLAGLMLEIRRDLLKKGDTVEAHDIRFTVQSMDGRRVDKIKVVVGQADE